MNNKIPLKIIEMIGCSIPDDFKKDHNFIPNNYNKANTMVNWFKCQMCGFEIFYNKVLNVWRPEKLLTCVEMEIKNIIE